MAVDKRPVGGTEQLDPDFGVQRIRDAAEAAESAAAVVAADLSAHEAAPDPHPGYLTQTEADALYDPLGGGSGTGNSYFPGGWG